MVSINIGVSSCLLGNRVRYDGRERKDTFIRYILSKHATLISICPETEMGLSVPRPPLNLIRKGDTIRLISTEDRRDYAPLLKRWAKKRIRGLKRLSIDGFIFKCRSPSCGLGDAKIYIDKGRKTVRGNGLFVDMVLKAFPLVPIESDERLYDPAIRESFFEKILLLKRWRDTFNKSEGLENILKFHRENRLIIRSKSKKIYESLERLISEIEDLPEDRAILEYQSYLLDALRFRVSKRKRLGVIRSIFKKMGTLIKESERAYIEELIALYIKDQIPFPALITPLRYLLIRYQLKDHLLDNFFNPTNYLY